MSVSDVQTGSSVMANEEVQQAECSSNRFAKNDFNAVTGQHVVAMHFSHVEPLTFLQLTSTTMWQVSNGEQIKRLCGRRD
jgi:hypothetical protein